jgi:hypothetical protein
MDKLGWFSLHPFASQIISFSILAWVTLVIISAAIAALRDHQWPQREVLARASGLLFYCEHESDMHLYTR